MIWKQVPICIWQYILEFIRLEPEIWLNIKHISTFFNNIIKEDWMCIRNIEVLNKNPTLRPNYLCCNLKSNEDIPLPTSLRVLHLQSDVENYCNKIFLPNCFTHLTKLESLGLSYGVQNVLVPTSLTFLQIKYVPNNFTALTNLIVLDLRNCNFINQHLQMKYFVHLRDFYFVQAHCTFEGEIPSLRTLYVLLKWGKTQLDSYIKQCQYVEKISFYLTSWDNFDTNQIVFPYLKVLELRGNDLVYIGRKEINCNKLPLLEEIRLDQSHDVIQLRNQKKTITFHQVVTATLCKKIYCECDVI